jgi:hypothetical protein
MRAIRGVNSIGSILQSFSILSHLDNLKLLSLLDEVSWRALLVACGSLRDEKFSGSAAQVILETMKLAGLRPDALTYVEYCKIFSRGRKQLKHEADSYLDPFFHLEQLGLSWFAQKRTAVGNAESAAARESLPRPQSAVSTHVEPTRFQTAMGSPNPTGGMWERIIGKKKSGEVDKEVSTKRASFNAGTAAVDLAKILNLSRSFAPFALRKPRFSMVSTTARRSRIEEADLVKQCSYTDQRIDERVRELQGLFFQVRDTGRRAQLIARALTQDDPDDEGENALLPYSPFKTNGESVLLLSQSYIYVFSHSSRKIRYCCPGSEGYSPPTSKWISYNCHKHLHQSMAWCRVRQEIERSARNSNCEERRGG